MGLNVNLIKMIGAPKQVICPKCASAVKTWCDDYDIECGEPNPKPNYWVLGCYCDNCGNDFKIEINLVPNVSIKS